MKNSLYYGDNLEVLRRSIADETVDLCYIDPPFYSSRSYHQVYQRSGHTEDGAQARAFTDCWAWDEAASEGLREIFEDSEGRFAAPTRELLKGLQQVIKESGLLAYLVSMTLRLVEIHRALKPTGSFYLHCDPTASHYLKLLLDTIYCARGGQFQNEIIWCYTIGGKSRRRFAEKHDTILFYTRSKGGAHTFNARGASIARRANSHMKVRVDDGGRQYQEKTDRKTGRVYRYYLDEGKIAEDYWTDIETLNRKDSERLGYPTQKPLALLERIIRTSSNAGDMVLDAYCGCGTTIAVAERLQRRWVGIDMTYQAISLTLKRLEDSFGREVLERVALGGVPSDMNAALALACKSDDRRLLSEFEKWAVLTYTNHRAMLDDRKGAALDVEGTTYFLTGQREMASIILQVKSCGLKPADVASLLGDLERQRAMMAVLITLEQPTRQMIEEARAAGRYRHEQEGVGADYDRIQLVTVREILEQHKRLNIPFTPAHSP